MPPKERRKGKKEIHKDNVETVKFYRRVSWIGSGVQITHLALFYLFASHFSWWNFLFLAFAHLVHEASIKTLHYLSKPLLGPSGELLEAGADLSQSYFSEYAIDAVILTAGLQILSGFSNYFWLLWLAGPGYVLYKLWVTFIWPWITAGPPEGGDTAGKGKEGKKHRQKVRRVQ